MTGAVGEAESCTEGKKQSRERKGRAQQEWLTQKWLREVVWDNWGGLTGRVLRYLDITRGLWKMQTVVSAEKPSQDPHCSQETVPKFLASVQGLFAPGSFTLVDLSSAINSTSKLPQPCLANSW